MEGNGSLNRLTTDHIMFNRIRRLVDGMVANVRDMTTNAYMTRAESIASAGKDDLDPRRSIFDECGFPASTRMTPQRWQLLYERDAIMGRVIEAMSKEAFQVQPDVYEKESGKVVTAWEKMCKEVSGSLRTGVIPSNFEDQEGSPMNDALYRAAVLAGIGRYGVVYLGLDDGLHPSKAVKGMEELGSIPTQEAVRNKEGELVFKGGKAQPEQSRKRGDPPRYSFTVNADATQGRRLGFLRVFPESLAYVTRWEANRRSPRYGMPVAYRLSFNDPSQPMLGIGMPLSTEEVHWTRCLHVADTFHAAPTSGSELWAIPRGLQVLNNVMSLSKVYGGSGEGYWKTVFAKLFLETHPQLGGDVDIDDDALKDMMEELMNGLQPWGALSGMSAKAVSLDLKDPTPHIQVQIEAICIKLGMPQRIFQGSERGQLASSQDDSAWNDRVKQFQTGWINTAIVRPFHDLLICTGVLPRPQKPLKIDWPDITSMSALEKAQVAQARMTALTTYLNGGGGQAMTLMDFFTKEWGLSEEDAKSRIDNLLKEAGDAYGEGEPDADMEELDYVAPESVEGEAEDAPAAEGEPGALGSVANVRMCWGKPCPEDGGDVSRTASTSTQEQAEKLGKREAEKLTKRGYPTEVVAVEEHEVTTEHPDYEQGASGGGRKTGDIGSVGFLESSGRQALKSKVYKAVLKSKEPG